MRFEFNRAMDLTRGVSDFILPFILASSNSWDLNRSLRTPSPDCPLAAAKAAAILTPRANQTPSNEILPGFMTELYSILGRILMFLLATSVWAVAKSVICSGSISGLKCI
jgi:hypothetical protein